MFYDIVDNGVRLQVLCNEANNTDTKFFPEVHVYFIRRDIIGVRGRPLRIKSMQSKKIALGKNWPFSWEKSNACKFWGNSR